MKKKLLVLVVMVLMLIGCGNKKFYLEDQYGRNYLNTSDIGYVISTPVVPEFLTGKEFLEFYIEINKDRITDLKTVDEYFDLVKIDKDSLFTGLEETNGLMPVEYRVYSSTTEYKNLYLNQKIEMHFFKETLNFV